MNVLYMDKNPLATKVHSDYEGLNHWLSANKLCINTEKTECLVFGFKPSPKSFGNTLLNLSNCCKYLGIWLDTRLTFSKHVAHVVTKLSKFCGIISRIRHYVSSSTVLRFYNVFVKHVIQYGILIYGSTTTAVLHPIFRLQKRILRRIFFCSSSVPSAELFKRAGVLSVYSLHIYELVKQIVLSCSNLQYFEDRNNWFQLIDHSYNTRSKTTKQVSISTKRTEFAKFSMKHRCTQLLRFARQHSLLLDINFPSRKEALKFVHTFRNEILANDQSLVLSLFE